MSDLWPLLVAESLDGERLVNSQLRPRAGAVAIGRDDYSAARQAVVELCGTWGGGGMPLVPVTVGESVDERWSRILNESNIDGIERTHLLSDEEVRKYTDLHGPDTTQLIRIVVDLERKPTVQTCQGLSEDDPWHLAYLAVLGDVSPYPHRQNTWNDLRPDLTFQDVLTIRGVDGDGSASGLLTLLRDFSAVSAIELSRSKLTGGLQASYNKGLSESSRFEWGDDGKAHQYGPNIVVVYQPGSVEDLGFYNHAGIKRGTAVDFANRALDCVLSCQTRLLIDDIHFLKQRTTSVEISNNNALYRIALVRMSAHQQTRDYVQRQHGNGRTKKEILRLLKRAIAREIFRLLTRPAPIDDYSDLRPARQAKNLTLATVATHFGVPLITISRLERGHQRNDTLANNYRRWLTAA